MKSMRRKTDSCRCAKGSLELPAAVELTLVPAQARNDSVDVKGTTTPLDQAVRPVAGRHSGANCQRPAGASGDGSGCFAVAAGGCTGAPGGCLGDVGGRRTPERAHCELSRCYGPGYRTIRADGADRQRGDDERLPDTIFGGIRKIYGGRGFGGDAARRRQMEVGFERSVSRFPSFAVITWKGCGMRRRD